MGRGNRIKRAQEERLKRAEAKASEASLLQSFLDRVNRERVDAGVRL